MLNVAPQEQTKRISGPEKVAALLLALETEVARSLLKHFAHDDLRRIARAAAELGDVPADLVRPLFDELVGRLSEDFVDVSGGVSNVEALLSGVVEPDEIVGIMSDIRGSSNHLHWRRLASVSEEVLSNYLHEEHPQTIALILSKMDSSFAARILGRLSAPRRNAAMRRMLTSRAVSDAALRILETTLNEDLISVGTSGVGNGANARVAGIINQMERDQMEEVLQSISEAEPTIAEKLRSLLFTFEDIPKLGSRARAVLFDQVPTERLILALHGADTVIRNVVLPNLSARTRRMVEAELSSAAKPQRKDMLRAQRAIADMVLALVEQGTIEIAASDESGAV